MTLNPSDILTDIAAELTRGELHLVALRFERGETGATVTTIVVSTAKDTEHT